MKIIYILWLRQIKRYLRSRSRLIGSLGQPILFLVALGYGFGAIYAKAGGGNYIEFCRLPADRLVDDPAGCSFYDCHCSLFHRFGHSHRFATR